MDLFGNAVINEKHSDSEILPENIAVGKKIIPSANIPLIFATMLSMSS